MLHVPYTNSQFHTSGVEFVNIRHASHPNVQHSEILLIGEFVKARTRAITPGTISDVIAAGKLQRVQAGKIIHEKMERTSLYPRDPMHVEINAKEVESLINRSLLRPPLVIPMACCSVRPVK